MTIKHKIDLNDTVPTTFNQIYALVNEIFVLETKLYEIETQKGNKMNCENGIDYKKCSEEILKVINYSPDSFHGKKIIEIIKRYFMKCEMKEDANNNE